MHTHLSSVSSGIKPEFPQKSEHTRIEKPTSVNTPDKYLTASLTDGKKPILWRRFMLYFCIEAAVLEVMKTERNFGFIHEKTEIKILILYIMRRIPEPVTFEILTGLTLCDGGISYFDYCESVAELVQTEHLLLKDDNYSLTAKGVRNGEATEISLPYSVRLKAESNASDYRAMRNRNAMIGTTHTVNPDGGYLVKLSLSDGVGDIISIEMIASSEKQALSMERGFRKDAENVYKSIIGMILN